ncbi:thiamine pyrophosphate-dependent enzyme [Chitinispirillales bacterium ANBcel5]|uniref:thiamine pyrophosphate-dependent enzyme n=1 Tax=Cellulosispirillum alkaliphilum TaxID=3039283 RepID=UPI002A597952|nr:thiamine pyrophosphate-dependent enzyme [Chitinispirillales bacterium ANBcel5]
MEKTDGKNYRSPLKPTWCKGCSYFCVLNSLVNLFETKDLAPRDVTVVSGIGCSSRLPFFLNTFAMHTLHGRALPVATGAHLSNPNIPVIVVGGDGDLFSIGATHFVHAARRNIDLTVICLNNRVYAMTKGQSSPTSKVNYKGTLTPQGEVSSPLNTIELSIVSGASLVCRSHCGDMHHLKTLVKRAFEHKGFSYLEILSPCKTFDKESSVPGIASRVIDINQSWKHTYTDRKSALKVAAKAYAFDTDKQQAIPVGVFWEEHKEHYREQLVKMVEKSEGKNAMDKIVSTSEVKYFSKSNSEQ